LSAASVPAGALAVLAALALAWGSNWPFMKIAFAELPVWWFRGWSCVAAALVIFAIAALRGLALMPRDAREWRALAIAGILNVSIWQITVAYGVQLLGSGHAAVLAFTMPLWAGLIAFVFFGEKLSRDFLIALAMGVAGVVLLSLRGGGFAWSDAPGIAFMFAAAIGWALGVLYGKRQNFSMKMLAVTAWQLLFGALPLLAIWPMVEPIAWPSASLIAWACAAYITFVSVVVGYISWFRLVEMLPAHVASLASLASPCVAMVAGWVTLGEALGLREIAALLLIVGALAIVLILPARRRPAGLTPS
jgi:drug/metabolite transporter (DMT)-like permease